MRTDNAEVYCIMVAQMSEILRLAKRDARPTVERVMLGIMCEHHELTPWELYAISSPIPEFTD